MASQPSKADVAEQLERTKKLLALPAEQIRTIAQMQRDAFAKKVDDFPSWTEGKFYRDELVQVDSQLRWGDELKDSTVEKDRQQRRRFYARAYLVAADAATRLDAAKQETSPSVLKFQDLLAQVGLAVEPVTQKAGEIVDTVVDTAVSVAHDVKSAAGQVLETGQNTLLLLGGLLGAAAIAYAVRAGGRRRRG